MKAVVQRILSGSVTVEGDVVGAVGGKGMAVLLGISRDDTEEDLEFMVRRLLGVRIWSSEDGSKMWSRNVREIHGEVLLISQFTLMHVMKGNKPDFHKAMNAERAREMFNTVRDRLQDALGNDRVATGKFQHYMNINLVNDGPVTLILDSKER